MTRILTGVGGGSIKSFPVWSTCKLGVFKLIGVSPPNQKLALVKVTVQANYSNTSRTEEPASAFTWAVSICKPAKALLFIHFKMIHSAKKLRHVSGTVGRSVSPLFSSDREVPPGSRVIWVAQI